MSLEQILSLGIHPERKRILIVKREPSGNGEWCEFEERPGPAPADAQEEENCTTICIVYRDRLIPQSGQAAPGRDEV